jgi:hypothetical protein
MNRLTFFTASSRDDLISDRFALLILTVGSGSVASSPSTLPVPLASTVISLFSVDVATMGAFFRAITSRYSCEM